MEPPWSHPWGSYPRSSNTKPRSAPAWAVSRQTSFRRPAKILSSGKLFCYSPGRRPPLEPEAAPLRWGAPPGEERQACPRHVQALPLHIACGRPPSCGFTVQFASALRFPSANGRIQVRHRSPAPPRGNDFQRHRIFLLLHRTSGGCAQDSPRIHPAVMPHPARGAGHPQRAVNHPAGGPRRRPFLWIDAWTPPQPEFETTQCTPWSHPWGSYPRSSNTKPPSAPAWAVRRQTSFRPVTKKTYLVGNWREFPPP